MKLKTFTTTLALTALLALSAVPALANEIISPANTGTTDLRAQVNPTYTVVIPESMTQDKSLKGGINEIGHIKTASLNLEPGTSLFCALKGDHLTRENGTETMGYTAYFGGDKNANRLELIEDTDTSVNVDVDSSLLAKAKAGTYKGTLTFTLAIQ